MRGLEGESIAIRIPQWGRAERGDLLGPCAAFALLLHLRGPRLLFHTVLFVLSVL